MSLPGGVSRDEWQRLSNLSSSCTPRHLTRHGPPAIPAPPQSLARESGTVDGDPARHLEHRVAAGALIHVLHLDDWPLSHLTSSNWPIPGAVPLAHSSRGLEQPIGQRSEVGMTDYVDIAGGRIAYDVIGEGPLLVLSHGIGDRRQAFRFLVPKLAAAGYRV